MAGFLILQEAKIPYNGSGTFVLAEAAFVPNTPISSSAMNSDLSDIATGLSTAVTKDGQTVITNPIRFASGSVGLPAITFSADTDCGIYRIGANNIGVSVNATKILDIATTGLGVTGTVAPSTTVTNATGTVLLPSYTFASDLNSGMYWIGADNIGVAVNGAKVLDIATTGLNVIGTIATNGAVLAPQPQAAGMINGTLVESHAGNAATFAVKTLAGTDPSASDPVYFSFRNTTPGTGNYVLLQVTAALSLVVTSGSTLGFTSGVPARVWVVAFNDASTVRLGVINCVSGTNIYPLGQFPVASSTAEGGAGGADSAQVFYTGSAVTSKGYAILGYASYEDGLATAGSWDASPTRLQLFGANVPLPGVVIQNPRTTLGTVATGSTAVPEDNTAPLSGEGNEYLTRAITPTSKANILQINSRLYMACNTAHIVVSALFQDAGGTSVAAGVSNCADTGVPSSNDITYRMVAGTVSSTTFRVRGGASSGTITVNGTAGSQLYGGILQTYMEVLEIMT